MNIGELTATLGIDDSGLSTAEKTFKEYGRTVKSTLDSVDNKIQRHSGLIEDIENHISKLKENQKKAFTIEGIERYNKKIAEAEQSLKEYNEAGLPAEKQTNALVGSISKMAMKLLIAIAAWKTFKDILESTSATSVKFHSVIEGAKTGLDYFKKSIASTDFSGFIGGLRNAIRVGRDFQYTMEHIEGISRDYQIKELDIQQEIEKQRMVMYENDKTSLATKIKAGEQILVLLRKQADMEIEVATETYQAIAEKTAAKNRLTEEEIRYAIQHYSEIEKVGKVYNQLAAVYDYYTDKQKKGLTVTDESVAAISTTYLLLKDLNIKGIDDVKQAMTDLGAEAPKAGKLMEALGKMSEKEKDTVLEAIVAVKEAENQYLRDARFIFRMTENMRDQSLQKQVTMYDNYWVRINNIAKNYPDFFDIKLKTTPQIDYQELFMLFDFTPMKAMEVELDNITRKNKAFGAGLDTVSVQSKTYAEQIDFITGKMQALWDEGFGPGTEAFDMYMTKLGVMQTELAALISAEEKHNETLSYKLQLMGEIASLGLAVADIGTGLIDRQMAKLDEQYKKDIELAGENAKKKIKIEEDYNTQKNTLMRKAAIAERLGAIFSIALDTAKGVMNAMSKIVTTPLVPWIIGVGAAQAAAVAAQPIPTMAEGGIVPSGYPGDTYPALLTSGERVIPPGKLDTQSTNIVVEDILIEGENLRIILARATKHHNAVT